MRVHGSIQNTLIYTQRVNFESDEYHSTVAATLEEARKLMEAGLAFVCDIEGVKPFSKKEVEKMPNCCKPRIIVLIIEFSPLLSATKEDKKLEC